MVVTALRERFPGYSFHLQVNDEEFSISVHYVDKKETYRELKYGKMALLNGKEFVQRVIQDIEALKRPTFSKRHNNTLKAARGKRRVNGTS
jgi:hypothetical protein